MEILWCRYVLHLLFLAFIIHCTRDEINLTSSNTTWFSHSLHWKSVKDINLEFYGLMIHVTWPFEMKLFFLTPLIDSTKYFMASWQATWPDLIFHPEDQKIRLICCQVNKHKAKGGQECHRITGAAVFIMGNISTLTACQFKGICMWTSSANASSHAHCKNLVSIPPI